MFSEESLNKIFLELFINDNDISLKPGAAHDWLKFIPKEGPLDCDVDTFASFIKGLIESKK